MAEQGTSAHQIENQGRGDLGPLLPLARVSETLLSEVEIERLYELILGVVEEETGADTISLMLLDETTQELCVEAALGLPEELVGAARVKIGERIAGWVLEKEEPLLLTDRSKVAPAIRDAMQREELTSALCVPLKIKGRVIGVLNASKTGWDSPFDDHDLELLSILASQVAIAIENSRVHAATRKRTNQLAALNEVGRVVISTLDLDEVLRLAMQSINQIIEAEAGSLLLLDETTSELVFRMSLHGDLRQDAPLTLQIGQGIAGWVVKEGQPLLVPDVSADPRHLKEAAEKFGLECRSILCVPLVIRDHVIGAIELINKLGGEFTGEDVELLNSMAATVAIALENARLYTELAEFARELEKSQAQLVTAEKLAATGRLAASLAHEINNPLQAIHNSLHLMLTFPLEPDEQREYLKMANEEVRRLIDMVTRILEFARRPQREMKPTSVNEVIEKVLALANKYLQHRHVTLRRDLAPDLPAALAAPDELGQVFLNLVLNAVDAMPDGGTLHVSSRLTDDGRLAMSFSDTGHGILPEYCDHIFEPFFSTKKEGTGLGLSVSCGTIKRHAGEITFQSTVERGTTFTVWLPAMIARNGYGRTI